ncbi:MAG TPA: AAA family ATPase, partial [Candidatus Nanoarchaeia archaeon]|nr:AAA family ATPase [Candidatus Nanoarchaeia archaeon]
MITKETLKDIARKQTGMSSDSIIRRDLEINTNTSHAVIISGIRRCGKSILLHLLMNGYKHPNYFNFEDPRLEEFKVHDFEKLTVALQELNDSDVFFFDEIQNVPAWENYVRSLLDQKKKVFLTGSNASLL